MNRSWPHAPAQYMPRTHEERGASNEQCIPASYDMESQPYSKRTFIDLFAGAGCLSLGLMASGWRGILAVEQNAMAFETLRHNLIDQTHSLTYDWPEWFPKEPCSVAQAASSYRERLLQLRGAVTMIVGGPPCQGFSLAGRRNESDSRNSLFKAYMHIVQAVQPLFILLENVQGITVGFDMKSRIDEGALVSSEPYSDRIARAINNAGYDVQAGLLKAVDYGVPQIRPRYFLIAARRDLSPSLRDSDPFASLANLRSNFLLEKGLPIDQPVSVKEAISDLETADRKIQCVDSPGFMQGIYTSPITRYQRLMRGDIREVMPDSHRLANHRPETVERFGEILASCRRGVQLNPADRQRFGLKKHCTVPLDPDRPSHTLTTLPDDIIHYSEARILTVREYARLQSIPDWFQFRGPYTTGGARRIHQCPRYTQAGNAVPPFVGEAIGRIFAGLHDRFLQSLAVTRPWLSEEAEQKPVSVGAM